MREDKITTKWDASIWKDYRGKKWNNRAEYDDVQNVTDRFHEMEEGRRTSCPWASVEDAVSNTTATSDGEEKTKTGSDWVKAWNDDIKRWSMWHEYLRNQSNLKSPISWSPVEAGMSEFVSGEKLPILSGDEKDEQNIQILQHIYESLHENGDFDVVNNSTFHESLICGSAWTYIPWIEQTEEKELILNPKLAREEAKELAESKEDKDKKRVTELKDKGKPLTKKVMVTKYDNPAIIHPSLFEIYIDPDARVLRGPAYEAKDICWEQLPSLDQFQNEFENSKDPYIIKENVKKVQNVQDTITSYTTSQPFFQVPATISKNKVRLLRYWNKITDKYMIIANDILIRNGPMPYNHMGRKELPFALHKAFDWPHQLYGMGFPRMLESTQAEDETLRNMALNQLKLILNPPIVYNREFEDDIDEGWEVVMPGQKFGISGKVDESNIRWLKGSEYRPDYYQMRNQLQEDAVKISGVNPLAFAAPKPGEPVRNNMMSLESTLKMFTRIINNWAAGEKDVVRQVLWLVMERYPASKVKTLNLQKMTVMEKTRSITTQDIELSFDDVGKLRKEFKPGRHDFEIKDEYLDITSDINIEIDIERILPMSTALRLQRLDKAMATLIPIFGNPAMLQNSAISLMVRDYVKLNGLDPQYLDNLKDEDSENDVLEAQQHNQEMKEGNYPENTIPGRSDAHLLVHTLQALEWISAREQITQKSKGENTNTNDILKAAEELQQIEQSLNILAKHMSTEQLPVDQSASAVGGIASQAGAEAASQQGAQPPINEGMGGQPQGAIPQEAIPQGIMQGTGPEQVTPEMMATGMGQV